MKKSNKKIPKTHLPKFYPGGRADDIRPPVDNNMYGNASTERDMMGPTQDMGVGTQNIYNQGRKSKINAGQYAQYGQAAMGLGTQLAANQSLTGEYKQEANNKAISGAVDSTLSTVTPWYGYAKAGSDIGRSMIQRDENGEPVGKMNKQLDAVMKPQHQMAIDDASKGNYGLAVAEMLLPGIGYESRSNSLGLGKGINRMFKSDNDSNYQYAMGGMNKYPGGGMGEGNGQVELDENSIAPNGQFTQFNELDHNQQDPNQPNASLAPGEMVFTARFGPKGKKGPSWADLNKANNTNREDKLLKDSTLSKASALSLHLTKMAKVKNSYNLFYNGQEAQKEEMASKAFDRTIKKYGIPPQLKGLRPSMDNEQMEPQGKMAMGGVQLPYYNTDNAGNPIYAMGGNYPAMTNPYNNFKGSIPMYPDGGVNAQGLTKPQYEQAQRDSMTLYKSGFGKVPNYKFPGFNDAQGRLTEISGIGTGETTIPKSLQGGTGTISQGSNDFSNIEQYQKPLGLPWKEYIPATEKSGVSIKNTNPSTSYQILRDNSRKITYKDGTTKIVKPGEFKYGGQMPKFLAGGESDDLTPEQQYTKTRFMGAEQNQKNLAFNQMTGNTNPGYSTYNSDYEKALQQTRDKVNAQQNKINPPQEEELQLANDVIDKQHGWNRNDLSTRPKSKSKSKTDPNDKNFDWGNLAMNVGNFAAQNVGNLYNLSRYNKPEVERYERAKATLLDPTAAIRNAMEQTRRAEYNVRGASGGNAGTYLANRVGLNAQNINTVDAIRQQYANANAGISNNFAQYNNQLAMQEVLANAQNRARYRSGKGEAISQIGKNYNQMALDTKKGKMDKSMMEMMPKLINNPEFQKFYTEWMKNNAGSSVV